MITGLDVNPSRQDGSPGPREIRDEHKEPRILYEEPVGCLIAEDTPAPEEKEAIESDDELADEDELWKALH